MTTRNKKILLLSNLNNVRTIWIMLIILNLQRVKLSVLMTFGFSFVFVPRWNFFASSFCPTSVANTSNGLPESRLLCKNHLHYWVCTCGRSENTKCSTPQFKDPSVCSSSPYVHKLRRKSIASPQYLIKNRDLAGIIKT